MKETFNYAVQELYESQIDEPLTFEETEALIKKLFEEIHSNIDIILSLNDDDIDRNEYPCNFVRDLIEQQFKF